MTFSQAIATCMGKYGRFKGRAGRSEYWWFYLFALLLGWGAAVVGVTVDEDWGSDLMSVMVSLALLVPTITVGARRLHDGGRSGWWQILAITVIGIIPLIIWMAQEGSKMDNEYGPPIAIGHGDKLEKHP